jgi:hypothetical protein
MDKDERRKKRRGKKGEGGIFRQPSLFAAFMR